MNSHRSEAAQLGFVAALVSAISFSTLSIFAKLLYSVGFSVASALAWRFIVASLFLWTMVWVRTRLQRSRSSPAARTQRAREDASMERAKEEKEERKDASAARKMFFRVFLLGLLGFSPQAGLFFVTVKILDPGITSLLLYLYPSFVFLITFLLNRQKPDRVQIVALLLSLAGCVITFWQAGSYPVVGLILGVLVALTYAAYLVAGERVLKNIDSLWATAVIMTAATLVYVCIALGSGSFIVPVSTKQILLVLCIALFATAAPIVTLFVAMQHIGARDTSIISTVEPVFTNILSALLFGELMTGKRILGGGLILASVLLLNIWGYSSQRRAAGAPTDTEE